jgi:cyclopropane-fatty-acyl-phospholipid synthase
MKINNMERRIRKLLQKADITLNGDRPYDLKIHNPATYERVLADGTLGLGESYMEGWWDCERLDEFVCKALRANLERHISPLKMLWPVLHAKWTNRQRRSKAFDIGQHHYDLGNDLYQCMLDRRMIYTCAYWQQADNLDQAQEDKLDLVCRKIGLQSGMTVLDIGCGWGGFARFAAEKYGAKVVGVTVSKEQIELGEQHCKGLPVELRLQDYRDVRDTFDRIVSLGMFEHVGTKNYKTFMRVVNRCLHDDSLFLLHTIGTNTPKSTTDPWIDKYIFPGGVLPTQKHIAGATERLFVMEDWHNFGADYDKTLMAWMDNVNAHWKTLQEKGYDQHFYRMWTFYLLSCAASFRARHNQVWQIVYSKQGIPGGYRSVR